jgi:Uma2 family endonuclease
MVYELTLRPDRWTLMDDPPMPDPVLQDQSTRTLVLVLEHRIATRGMNASTGAHLAVRWDHAHPTVGVDPDVYLVEPALAPDTTSLRVWEAGRQPPRLAVEIVSQSTADVDYLDKPERYAASGTRELWIFDPQGFGPSVAALGGPYRLQVWRRVAKDKFKRIFAGEGPGYSRELGAWIVVTSEGRELRLADDRAGTRLWPTAAEAERQAREVAETAREAAETAREVERQAREAAERETEKAQGAALALLCGLVGQRLRRPLPEDERRMLGQRLTDLGADRVSETLFTLDDTALVAWLGSPPTDSK